MTPEEKDWIDNASYEDLLRKWRFDPVGSAVFQKSEYSSYFSKTMYEAMEKCDYVAAGKRVGWREPE